MTMLRSISGSYALERAQKLPLRFMLYKTAPQTSQSSVPAAAYASLVILAQELSDEYLRRFGCKDAPDDRQRSVGSVREKERGGRSSKCREGASSAAKETFHRMPQWSVVSWTSLLGAFADEGELHDAECPQRKVVTWGALSQCYAIRGLLGAVHDTFERMPEQNEITWNVFVAASADKGYFVQAEWLFRAMPERSIVSWNAMVSKYSRSGLLVHAKAVFDVMPSWDAVSWNTFLAAYAQEGHLDMTLCLYTQMPSRDMVTENTIMSVLGDREARDIFRAMRCRDVTSWTSVLEAHSGSVDFNDCKSIFDRMPAWSQVTLIVMLQSNVVNGDIQSTKDTFDTMPVVVWTAMLTAYGQSGDLSAAEDLFNRMPGWSTVSWAALQSASTRERAKELFDNMPALEHPLLRPRAEQHHVQL